MGTKLLIIGLDGATPELVERWVEDDTTVIVMSDHGGGPHPKYFLNTNYFLRTLNLLELSAKASKSGLKAAFKQFYRTKIRRFPYLEMVYRRLPQRLKRIATNVDSQTMRRP